MLALGLMSGTSMDGIDVALVETDGRQRLRFGPTGFAPYSDADRTVLRQALAVAVDLDDRDARPGILAEAETRLTTLHVAAVRAFVQAHPEETRGLELVGFHGQTVLHRPERRLTVQIGDGAVLARDCGIDTVADLRAADVAAGGQGAPLVPAFHRALTEAAALARPAVLLNVGGVANLTYLSADDADPIAFDTGPGNALVDDLMLERTGQPYDRDGTTAAAGRVHAEIVDAMLQHAYFAAPPPKSLDRNDWSRELVSALSTGDAAASLTDFTAATVARAFRLLPAEPQVLVVCGGGAHNAFLMGRLRARLPCRIVDAAALGWSGDAIEAQAFAYLAVRSRLGLPITFPGTTGVASPLTGGVFHAARG